jgi:CRISPR-associated protein Cmr4
MSNSKSNEQAFGFLYLHAQTSLHPGSGTALGVVDLPVQRERHTQWPTIPASALKGVLRDASRRLTGLPLREADRDAKLAAVFGPPTSEAAKHAGALSFTDARLLCFPVRSLSGVFAWVTCSAALERLARDLGLAGEKAPFDIPRVEPEKAACSGQALLVGGSKLVLEEFEFTLGGNATEVAAWIAERAFQDRETAGRFKEHLAVLHDNDFTHFARHATEVAARIALDYERKTVRDGALFYEEFVPAESIFYSLVLASASRRQDEDTDAAGVLGYLRQVVGRARVIQVGGDETIGKGLCALSLR